MARAAEGWRLRRRSDATTWRVRFTHNGRRVDVSTGCRDKASAARAAAQIYAQHTTGHAPSRIDGDFFAICDRWLGTVRDTRSAAWFRECQRYLAAYWDQWWGALDDVNSQSVQGYIGWRLETVSPTTVRKELSALSRFLHWCVDCGLMRDVPKWQAPKARSDYQATALTRDQVARLLALLPDQVTHRAHRPVREYYSILYWCAFRRATLQQLRWGDVDLHRGVIRVRASADKARRSREVPLPKAARAVLMSMERGEGLIFGRVDYKKQLAKAMAEAGLSGSGHTLRHSRLTHLAESGASIATLQLIAGHSTLEMTARYVHPGLASAQALLKEIGE